jgi:hypothetical protein
MIFQNCVRKCPVNWGYASDSTLVTKFEQENAQCVEAVVVLYENTGLKSLAWLLCEAWNVIFSSLWSEMGKSYRDKSPIFQTWRYIACYIDSPSSFWFYFKEILLKWCSCSKERDIGHALYTFIERAFLWLSKLA